MNSLERMMAAVRGEPFDVYPFVNPYPSWSMMPHWPAMLGLTHLHADYGSDNGFDNPAINGSLVGYANPPFAEQAIVHSGSQSMPFAYDNGVGKSEATLTLTDMRDWTQEGVGVLSLWFYGDTSNAAEPMYVVLNGSAVVSHDDPDAALINAWTEWSIDLQAFGVNLANVNTITLGFGNRTNPVAGGVGMVFFDDIRLYRPAP